MRFPANNTYCNKQGRIVWHGDTAYLGYSASSVEFRFAGRKAVACLVSDPDSYEDNLQAQVAVFINDEDEPYKRFTLKQGEREYALYESPEEKEVTLRLVKYSETAFAGCGIKYFEIDTERLLAPPPLPERKIEIIGDSITCGYGVEAASELITFDTRTENPMKSYSMLTAKALQAQVHLVSFSGNGIISHYVEETATQPQDEILMPLLYDYTDPASSARVNGQELTDAHADSWEKWDFSNYEPQLILINLGTNDGSWCKAEKDRKESFRDKYRLFLEQVRARNPQAKLLCMLGTMDQRLVDQVEEAVQSFKDEHSDDEIAYLHLPEQNPADGYGADWHPCEKTQRDTAELVIEAAKKLMNWA